MSKNDDLQTFKIGDTQSPGIEKARPALRSRQQDQQSEAASVGFNRIERILEDEDPVRVSNALGELHQKLEERLESVQTQREKAGAKRALVAVERAADLMDYLFQTKASMEHDDS